MRKTCPRCGADKPATPEFFHRNRAKSDGLAVQCQACFAEIDRQRYARIRDRKLDNSRDWYAKNQDRKAETRRAWLSANRSRRREWVRQYLQERRDTDPIFRLNDAVKVHVRRNGGLGRPWPQIVGYDLPTLCAHLEGQFAPEMSWENYGTYWEVDHRRPKSSFDLPREITECWSLENLRPLPASENRRKGTKLKDAA